MKYTIAVAALLGKTNALAAYGTLVEYASGSDGTGVKNVACQDAMRGQKTTAWSYWSKYVYQNALTTKTIDSKKVTEIVCSGNTAVVDKCSEAWTTAAGPPKTVTVKTGFAYIKGDVALAGNRINGVHACPQEVDRCPGKRFRAVAAADSGKTATEIKMALTSVIAGGCSYLIEAECDAPYVAVKTSADYTAGQYTGTTWAVVEYDSSFEEIAGATKKFWTSSEVTSRIFAPGTAQTDFENGYTAAELAKIPSDLATFDANTGTGKGQGLAPSVRKVAWFKGTVDQSSISATNTFDYESVNALWAAKRAEYAAYASTKSAYETKRDDYNTKLDAAEKLVKDKLDKDIFRKLSPTADDKKVLNAVPARPSNPSIPPAYAGPTVGASATKYVKDTFWVLPLHQSTDVTDPLHLAPGKAFGTAGTGTNTQTVATAGDSLKSDALGVIFT